MKLAVPLHYAQANRARFIAELKDFVRFPSVSAQPQRAVDVKRCAAWLASHLQRIGLEQVRIMPTARHPVVYAEWRHAVDCPTVLIYGHYDVQPAEPLNEWHSPPFEPTVRGDNLYGRGACDDKGQMFAHVKALEAYLCTTGRLPVNVICLFEGEEEIGSPNLNAVLTRCRDLFAADAAVMSDMPILAPDRPAITIAMRGALSLELEVRSLKRDLHSGIFGGSVHNALQALCELLARLHDAQGRVTIPGFYDCVRRWPASKRDYMARSGPTDAQMLRDAGARTGWGERAYSLYERTTIRPALTLNGIVGGYQGAGGKAVIPARATAKLSFRLVPDQDPRQIEALFRRYIAQITPATVRTSIRTDFHAQPSLVPQDHPAVRAAARAYQQGFGAAPVFLRSGGSIPVVNMFQDMLNIPTVLMGFALPDDRMHAPNEKFHLPNFFNGITTSLHFLAEMGKLSRERRR